MNALADLRRRRQGFSQHRFKFSTAPDFLDVARFELQGIQRHKSPGAGRPTFERADPSRLHLAMGQSKLY